MGGIAAVVKAGIVLGLKWGSGEGEPSVKTMGVTHPHPILELREGQVP